MAYVTQPEDENVDNNGGPLVPGGAPTPTAAPSIGSQTAQKPKTPGNFADLGEYLRVNSGQNFGNQLAGKIGSDVDAAGNQLGQASNEFKSRADANTITDSQGLTSQLGTSPESIDPTAFAKIRDATYNGPTNFSDASDLYNQTYGTANAAAGKAEASKSEGGRFALLDSYYGKPKYTQGQKTLDNLLVQNDPNSQQAFKQIQQNAQNLQANVAQTDKSLTDYGNQDKIATQTARQNARNAVGIDDSGNLTGTGALGNLSSSVNQKLTDKQAEADRIASLSTNPDTLNKISPDLANYLGSIGASYGVDPRKYLSETPKESLTDSGVASPQDLARMKALSQLAGVNDSYDVEGAGQYADSPLYSFDKGAYGNIVGTQKQNYQTQYQPIVSNIDWLNKNIAALRTMNPNTQYQAVQSLPNGIPPTDGTVSDALNAYQQSLTTHRQNLDALKSRYGLPSGGSVTTGGVTGLG